MSRLFWPNRFCPVKCPLLSVREPELLTLRAAARQLQQRQQPRRSVSIRGLRANEGARWGKQRGKSRAWAFGAVSGVALALGLSCGWCEDDHGGPAGSAERTDRYRAAATASREFLERIQAEVAAPGIVVGVSVDGAQVWCEGIGFADLENRVPCGPDTVMRIASISKSLTSAAAARLCEEGKLDLDAPVQKYVPEFPQKQFEGEDVTVTPRMILSHLSGIRHYEKDAKKVREDKEKAKRLPKPPAKDKEEEKKNSSENKDPPTITTKTPKNKEAPPPARKKEFEQEEYYLKDSFESVVQSLDIFKDDPLIFKPGSTFLYSTHAFTLLSAVMERAANRTFLDLMMNLFREVGMSHTVPDENDPIIYHRSRYYHFNKRGRVTNCPYVDNSYKWAGGGFLSTAGDLLLFGNALLYSFQVPGPQSPPRDPPPPPPLLLPGFLAPRTVTDLWTPAPNTEPGWDKDGAYGQGWLVVERQQRYGQCRTRRHYVSHTGGAVGASSVLLILPGEGAAAAAASGPHPPPPPPPRGVVVAILTNMQSVGLNGAALKIALEFDEARGR